MLQSERAKNSIHDIDYAIITDMESKPSINNLEAVKSRELYQPQQGTERTPLSPEATVEHRIEAPHRDTTKASPPPTQTLPSLPTPIQADDSKVTTQAVDDSPLTANDDDLIEKEWVDRAKQIIVSTKDDPHLREQEVAKLQVDYLRKRYGKEPQ